MPRNTFAAITQLHAGAHINRKGTGSPAIHPATSSSFRPARSDHRPAARFVTAFTTPKLTMKDRIAAFDARPKSRSASSGNTARSSPTIPPTNALTTTSSENWRQLRFNPSARLASASVVSTGKVGGANPGGIWRRGRDVPQHRGDKFVAVVETKRAVEPAFEANRGRRLAAQRTATDGSRKRAGPHLHVIRKTGQPSRAFIQEARAFASVARQFGSPHVADHQGVAGENHPGLGTSRAV